MRFDSLTPIFTITRAAMALICIVLLVSIVACGGKEKQDPATVVTPASSPEQIKWTYQTNAIHLNLRVDDKLNQYNNSSHTLLLCIYQLSRKNKFAELAKTSTGVSKLINCMSFDATVADVQRIFVQPGRNSTLELDRAEGARFVGVAAGYYNLEGQATRTWQIPVKTWTTGFWPFSDTWYAPAKLDADLILGPHQIQKIGE